MIPPNGAPPSTGYNNADYLNAPIERTRTNMSGRMLEEGQVPPRPILEREITDEKFGLVGRRKKLGERKEEELNGIGKLYYKIYNASIVTRYFIYLVPLSVLLAIPTIVGATLSPEAKERNRIGGVQMHWFFLWVSRYESSIQPNMQADRHSSFKSSGSRSGSASSSPKPFPTSSRPSLASSRAVSKSMLSLFAISSFPFPLCCGPSRLWFRFSR